MSQCQSYTPSCCSFVAMPQTITPLGLELNPSAEHIDEPYSDKVLNMLKRKGVKLKTTDNNYRNIEPKSSENIIVDKSSS